MSIFNHTETKISNLPSALEVAITEIISINLEIASFWKASHGWAPPSAAQILSVSRLDRQISLSKVLEIWSKRVSIELTDGELILAWANLGALVEGSMKLLLAVFFEDYIKDTENIVKAGAYNKKKNAPKSPDALTLEQLKIYFREQELLTPDELLFVDKVQSNRNILHAFQDAELSNTAEFIAAIFNYLSLLKGINLRLPYPHNL